MEHFDEDVNNKAYAEAREAVEALHSVHGYPGFGVQAFVQAFAHEHRTIQQNIMKQFVGVVEHLASLKPGEYDLRNEDSVRLAKALVASPEWEKNKYLRYV